MFNIGWIGTGRMGAPMCRHLIEAGHTVTVYNRTKSKAEELIRLGARWADSPENVAKNRDFVCTVVGVPEEVRDIVFGTSGILKWMKPGSVFVDFSTSTPSLAVEIASALRRIGASALDAPISGGEAGSRSATLSIMVGGEVDSFDRALPLLKLLGKTIVHHGPAGSGQHMKICNQIQVAHTAAGMAEAFVYAEKSGLDLEKVFSTLSQGAARSWCLETWGPGIVNGTGNGDVGYWIKDLGIALREAELMDLPLPVLAAVHQLYVSARAVGSDRGKTLAPHVALKRMAGLD